MLYEEIDDNLVTKWNGESKLFYSKNVNRLNDDFLKLYLLLIVQMNN